MRLDDKFIKALETISERLEGKSVNWAVIGSTNMALQGMEVEPKDLDLVVSLDDLKKIAEVFPEYLVDDVKELQTKSGEPAWEVKLDVNGVEVQILGELTSGQYVSKLLSGRLTEVKVGDKNIPCFTLGAEAQAYAETNHPAKSELIKKFLRS